MIHNIAMEVEHNSLNLYPTPENFTLVNKTVRVTTYVHSSFFFIFDLQIEHYQYCTNFIDFINATT